MDVLHAVVSGLVIGAIYLGLYTAGVMEGRTKVQRALIIAPVVFVVMLILNLIWPS